MVSRLAGSFPEVDKALSRIPSESTGRAGLLVAHWALSTVGYKSPLPRDPAAIEALVESFDNEYFDLEDRGEQEASVAFFSTARALHSMHFALKGDLAEAVYEAIAATDDPEGALRACILGPN